ncbi:MAG: hypothetical protein CRN43_11120 [Candidatus Nephrothrix sp. EaCA]|nr:MAG: hypothetical protein CRN43_11120 [Candidatus Nephrothrix sp. EaCA]
MQKLIRVHNPLVFDKKSFSLRILRAWVKIFLKNFKATCFGATIMLLLQNAHKAHINQETNTL